MRVSAVRDVGITDKAFRKPEDRPEPVEIDAEVLAEAIRYATTRNKDSNDDSSKKKSSRKVKLQGDIESMKLFAIDSIEQIIEKNPEEPEASEVTQETAKNIVPSSADQETSEDLGDGERKLVDSTKKEAVKSDANASNDKALEDMGDVSEAIKTEDMEDCSKLLD